MNILIAGIGAIGSNLASLLARDLDDKWTITVLDKDAIEERNIQAGTQFYTKDQIGLRKVEALQFNVYEAYGREIEVIDESLLILKRFPKTFDLIVDCLDNKEARGILQKMYEVGAYIDNGNDPYELLHVGFSDDFTFAIEWADNYEIPDNTVTFDICEMPGAASFVTYVAAVASSVIIENVETSQKIELVGNKYSLRRIV